MIMTDFTWYSRLLVWVGALVLLIESFSGRSVAILTVLAVVALTAGLVGFAGGLAAEGGAFRWFGQSLAPASSADEVVDEKPGGTGELPAAQSPSGEQVEPRPGSVMPLSTEPASATGEAARSDLGAVSTELDDTSVLAGQPCLLCHEPLRSGDVAAVCAVCGAAHHASCWVGNHFHCARQGCAGHGGLRAPESVSG